MGGRFKHKQTDEKLDELLEKWLVVPRHRVKHVSKALKKIILSTVDEIYITLNIY